VAGDLFWKRSGEPERSVDSRRQLPDADDYPSPAPELAGDAAVAGHVGLAFAVPELSVGPRAGVTLGAAVPEPSLWEQTRKTTEGGPKGVAPFAGMQMPSNIRRRRRRLFAWGRQSRAFLAKADAFSIR